MIPLAIVLVLAAFGGIVLNTITKAGPAGTELEINVTAQRFAWQFQYPAYNISSYELHVPVNQRLHLVMQSKDVVHSFWVQQWGPKQDIVPGMTTEVRYTPTKTGQFLVQCSQLCGYGHSNMTGPGFRNLIRRFCIVGPGNNSKLRLRLYLRPHRQPHPPREGSLSI